MGASAHMCASGAQENVRSLVIDIVSYRHCELPNMGAGPLEDKQELLTVKPSFQSLQALGQHLETSLLDKTPVDQIETGHCIRFISVPM